MPRPPVTDFDSIIGLLYSVLTDKTKTGDNWQAHYFCRFLGLLVKGARAKLERRTFEFKTKMDASDAILPSALPSHSHASVAGGGVGNVSTPKRRECRRRSSHCGNTVVTCQLLRRCLRLIGYTNVHHHLTRHRPCRIRCNSQTIRKRTCCPHQ